MFRLKLIFFYKKYAISDLNFNTGIYNIIDLFTPVSETSSKNIIEYN